MDNTCQFFPSGPTQASVSRTVTAVTNILSTLSVSQIKMPSTPQDLKASAQAFERLSNFPRVIGIIDCEYVFKFYMYALMQGIVTNFDCQCTHIFYIYI